ncbi:MAG: hypothetical protein ACI4QL_05055, partial [Candidatus Fimimonas sp.]
NKNVVDIIIVSTSNYFATHQKIISTRLKKHLKRKLPRALPSAGYFWIVWRRKYFRRRDKTCDVGKHVRLNAKIVAQ